MKKTTYVIYLLVFILAFGCKEVTKKEVSETPILNTVGNIKVNTEQNAKCINFLASKKPSIFPLNGRKMLNEEYMDRIIEIENLDEQPNIIKGILCGDGVIFDINCSGKVNYRIISSFCNNDNHFVNLAIIKGDKVDMKKLHGAYVHDFRNIDRYSFVLDHDSLEITKINHANTDSYEEKEVSREVTKYKLTDQGLVEQ
ncbi:hypothetical protein ACE1MK_01220 [Tenacibaculum maritimum]|uniref:hypothetical protein n=1 Tax=Tenacibaculum maritimum TaxID=107401 RepID=UPI0012E568A1|nr:hypothetical protein [Tenacibaculum maritimum]CAA0231521.1 hypothetical protein FS0810_40136 [Tenacibaculum maritimum]CAA0242913.1 hypothetical protein USCSP91_60002 [Tenacibaculum maritimum]